MDRGGVDRQTPDRPSMRPHRQRDATPKVLSNIDNKANAGGHQQKRYITRDGQTLFDRQ